MTTMTRRDIRRAMGPEARAVLAHHTDTIRAVTVTQAQVSDAVQQWAAACEALCQRTTAAERALDHLTSIAARPFMGRIRWLVTGR